MRFIFDFTGKETLLTPPKDFPEEDVDLLTACRDTIITEAVYNGLHGNFYSFPTIETLGLTCLYHDTAELSSGMEENLNAIDQSLKDTYHFIRDRVKESMDTVSKDKQLSVYEKDYEKVITDVAVFEVGESTLLHLNFK